MPESCQLSPAMRSVGGPRAPRMRKGRAQERRTPAGPFGPDAAAIRTMLAAIVESSDDAIVSKDLNGTIMTWNAGAEHIFGYTAEEAVGQPILMLVPPERYGE